MARKFDRVGSKFTENENCLFYQPVNKYKLRTKVIDSARKKELFYISTLRLI